MDTPTTPEGVRPALSPQCQECWPELFSPMSARTYLFPVSSVSYSPSPDLLLTMHLTVHPFGGAGNLNGRFRFYWSCAGRTALQGNGKPSAGSGAFGRQACTETSWSRHPQACGRPQGRKWRPWDKGLETAEKAAETSGPGCGGSRRGAWRPPKKSPVTLGGGP